MINTIISCSGSYIASHCIANSDFEDSDFYESTGLKTLCGTLETIDKFREITGITERKYISDDLVTSDIALLAAEDALTSGRCDRESLDLIIVAHNFGDVKKDHKNSELVPSLASKVKLGLGIKNPATVAYDLIFGCAGWLQAVIQAHSIIKAGDAKNIMIIGADALSRVTDPYDKDSMLFGDGAGAVVVSAINAIERSGVLSSHSETHANANTCALNMGRSNYQDYAGENFFLKMQGRLVYEFAITQLPGAMKQALDKSAISISDIGTIIMHQANKKMMEAILKRFYLKYGAFETPCDIMPVTVSWLGNSSVATLPTLYDLVLKGKIENKTFEKGHIILFASVGAGLNVNAVVYKVP